jgi:hypothetical protein
MKAVTVSIGNDNWPTWSAKVKTSAYVRTTYDTAGNPRGTIRGVSPNGVNDHLIDTPAYSFSAYMDWGQGGKNLLLFNGDGAVSTVIVGIVQYTPSTDLTTVLQPNGFDGVPLPHLGQHQAWSDGYYMDVDGTAIGAGDYPDWQPIP